MIDLHCHILPGLDDGAKTLEESIAMAELALEDGVTTMVATPHMLNGVYRNDPETIRLSMLELKEALDRQGLPLRLFMGGDVHLVPDMTEAVRKGLAVTIDDMGKYLLLELPHFSIPTGVKEEIFQLMIHGITPIITHPERNPVILQDPMVLAELVDMGSLAQVTAMSLTGGFGEVIRQSAAALVKRRLVHVIASDAHSSDVRPPGLSEAVEAAASILGGLEEAERMVTHTPAAILAGEHIHTGR